jgi:peptidoglycan DL-endopeptidase CwlO
VESVALDTHDAFVTRIVSTHRSSRSAARRAAAHRAALRTPSALVAARTLNLAVFGRSRPGSARKTAVIKPVAAVRARPVVRTRPTAARTLARRAVVRPVVAHRQTYRAVVVRHMAARPARRVALGGGMSAVIAYAREQVGRRYVTGGEGGSGFDCSGLTRRAYEQAGIDLPHSSYAQAARARAISRRFARPGDLVIGRGHVGIYMGHGMMIDAGNHRTGVVYRKLYSGLRVGRL